MEKEYYKNGNKRYEGDFKDGKQHRTGIEYYENGQKKYEAGYKLGQYHNKGIEYDKNEKILY